MGKIAGSLTKPEPGTFNDFVLKVGKVFDYHDRFMRNGQFMYRPAPETGDIAAIRIWNYYVASTERNLGWYRFLAAIDLGLPTNLGLPTEAPNDKEAYIIERYAHKLQKLDAADLLITPDDAKTDHEIMSRMATCFYLVNPNRAEIARLFNKGLPRSKAGVNGYTIRNAIEGFMWEKGLPLSDCLIRQSKDDDGNYLMLLHGRVAVMVHEAWVLWGLWKRTPKNSKDQFDANFLDAAIENGLIFEWRAEIEARVERRFYPRATKAFQEQLIRRLDVRKKYLEKHPRPPRGPGGGKYAKWAS